MSKKIAYHYLAGLLTIVIEGHAYDVDKKHPKYKEILEVLKAQPSNALTTQGENWKAQELIKLIKADTIDLRNIAAQVGFEDVKVSHGVVTVKGKALHNSLTKRILALQEDGVPFAPFVRFLVNLEANRSEESRNALFDFLDQGKFPLTEDGCFLGYKGVVEGELKGKMTLVDAHSRSFDMAPGNTHEMPWEKVDNNNNEACGAGFHVGTINHARGFGGKMIVVKVNPKDCVSVPRSDTTKLRCCKYEVVNIFKSQTTAEELPKQVYSPEEIKAENFEEIGRKPMLTLKILDLNDYTRDQLVRIAVNKGLVNSANMARALGKDLLVLTVQHDGVPWHLVQTEDLAALATRRHLFSSEEAARKAGRTKMIARLSA